MWPKPKGCGEKTGFLESCGKSAPKPAMPRKPTPKATLEPGLWAVKPKAGMSAGSPLCSVLPVNVPNGFVTELSTVMSSSANSALNSILWPSSWVSRAGFRFRAPRASLGSATPAPPMELLTAPIPCSWLPLPAQAGSAAQAERRRAKPVNFRDMTISLISLADRECAVPQRPGVRRPAARKPLHLGIAGGNHSGSRSSVKGHTAQKLVTRAPKCSEGAQLRLRRRAEIPYPTKQIRLTVERRRPRGGRPAVRAAAGWSPAGSERRKTGMVEPDVAVRVADPVLPGLPDWANRHTDNALVGWMVVVALTLVGFLLLALGGGPAWPRFIFLAIGLAAAAAYGVWVYPFFRNLERKLPQNEERWSQLEGKL